MSVGWKLKLDWPRLNVMDLLIEQHFSQNSNAFTILVFEQLFKQQGGVARFVSATDEFFFF